MKRRPGHVESSSSRGRRDGGSVPAGGGERRTPGTGLSGSRELAISLGSR
jgi:hypothetical protein